MLDLHHSNNCSISHMNPLPLARSLLPAHLTQSGLILALPVHAGTSMVPMLRSSGSSSKRTVDSAGSKPVRRKCENHSSFETPVTSSGSKGSFTTEIFFSSWSVSRTSRYFAWMCCLAPISRAHPINRRCLSNSIFSSAPRMLKRSSLVGALCISWFTTMCVLEICCDFNSRTSLALSITDKYSAMQTMTKFVRFGSRSISPTTWTDFL
mmetsp:Transcript_15101/g.28572  ORF Transcript_15101/g.28572 Transcript_15101/m.28572 type:complete len:209 (-) Transcript_15101:622-1248(-)